MDQILSMPFLQPVLEAVRAKAASMKRPRGLPVPVSVPAAPPHLARHRSNPASSNGSPERAAALAMQHASSAQVLGEEAQRRRLEAQLRREYEQRTALEQRMARLRMEGQRGQAQGANDGDHPAHVSLWPGGLLCLAAAVRPALVFPLQTRHLSDVRSSRDVAAVHGRVSERPMWLQNEPPGPAADGDDVLQAEQRLRQLRRDLDAVRQRQAQLEAAQSVGSSTGHLPQPQPPAQQGRGLHRRSLSSGVVDFDPYSELGPRSSRPSLAEPSGTYLDGAAGNPRGSYSNDPADQLSARRLARDRARAQADGLDAAHAAAALPVSTGIPRASLGRRNPSRKESWDLGLPDSLDAEAPYGAAPRYMPASASPAAAAASSPDTDPRLLRPLDLPQSTERSSEGVSGGALDPKTRARARKAEEIRRHEQELLEARRQYYEERRNIEQIHKGTGGRTDYRNMVPGMGGAVSVSSTLTQTSGRRSGLGGGGGSGATSPVRQRGPVSLPSSQQSSPVKNSMAPPYNPTAARPVALPPKPRTQAIAGAPHHQRNRSRDYMDPDSSLLDLTMDSLSSDEEAGPSSAADPGAHHGGGFAHGSDPSSELRRLEQQHDSLSSRITDLEAQIQQMTLQAEAEADPGLAQLEDELERSLQAPRAGEMLSSIAFREGSPSQRIQALREVCVRNLGVQLFDRLYSMLKERALLLTDEDALHDEALFRVSDALQLAGPGCAWAPSFLPPAPNEIPCRDLQAG